MTPIQYIVLELCEQTDGHMDGCDYNTFSPSFLGGEGTDVTRSQTSYTRLLQNSDTSTAYRRSMNGVLEWLFLLLCESL